jgi:hypothetical protein
MVGRTRTDLQLAIVHEQDLAVSAAPSVGGNPDATQTQSVRSANSIRALQRQPDLPGFGETVMVPAS